MLGRSALLAATNSENYGNWLGNYSDVSLLLRNGTPALVLLDESQAPNTITVFGNASVTTAVAKWNQGSGGSSLSFDGSGDYLSANDPAFAPGIDAFTVECWIRFTALPSFGQISGICGTLGAPPNALTSANSTSWWFGLLNDSGTLKLTLAAHGPGSPYARANWTPASGVWYHVAAVRQATGVNLLFVDGNSQLVTQTSTAGWAANNFLRTNLGVGVITTPAYLNGYIDDLRITKGIARYETGTGANAGKMVFAGTNTLALPTAQLPANITDDPSYNSVSLLLRGATTATLANPPLDESPTPKTITAVGDAGISTTVFKYGTSSLVFDGSGDYFDFTDSSNTLDIGGTNATLEGWVRVNTGGSGGKTIISKHGGQGNWNTSNGFLYQLSYDYSAQRFVFAFNNGGGAGGATGIGGGSQPPGTDWYHIAVVTNTSNNITLFVNGISVATTTNAISKPVTRTSVRIGNDLASAFFNGYIDDLRHTRVARYTSNFTPPPAELPAF